VIPAQRLDAAGRTSIFAGDFGSGIASAATSVATFDFSDSRVSDLAPTISSSSVRIAF
jgi:hypothetical protein